MNNIFRGLIAGYGAKKLGGGCFSMVLIFIIIWVALGQCEHSSFGERQRIKQQKQVGMKSPAPLAWVKTATVVRPSLLLR